MRLEFNLIDIEKDIRMFVAFPCKEAAMVKGKDDGASGCWWTRLSFSGPLLPLNAAVRCGQSRFQRVKLKKVPRPLSATTEEHLTSTYIAIAWISASRL